MSIKEKIQVTILLVLAFACPLAAQSQAVGMLLMIGGQVSVTRDGEEGPGAMADLIMAGDRIRVSGGTAELLFCPANSRIKLADGATVQVTSTEVKTLGGPAAQAEPAQGCMLPQVAIGSESLERVGGLRGRGSTPIPVYVGGKITTARPIFEWEPIEGGVEFYVVTVRDQFGSDLWKSDPITSGTRVSYPKGDLDPNRYSWEVRAFKRGAQDLEVGQQSARFEVRPSPDLGSPVGADSASRLIRAVQLENNGYFAEAAALYRALRAEFSDERLTKRLAVLYWQSGLITAANQEKERLEDQGPKRR